MKEWDEGQEEIEKCVTLPIPAPSSRFLHHINPCRLLSASIWTPPVIMIHRLTWQLLPCLAVLSDQPQSGFWKGKCRQGQRRCPALHAGEWCSSPGAGVQPHATHTPPCVAVGTNSILSSFPKVLRACTLCHVARGRGRCQQLPCCTQERQRQKKYRSSSEQPHCPPTPHGSYTVVPQGHLRMLLWRWFLHFQS